MITDIEAEVRYAVRHEYAQTAVDVIARRTRLSFLNAQAALTALPRVVELMSAELNWSLSRRRQELASATNFLVSMGLPRGAQVPEAKPHGFLERLETALWWGLCGGGLLSGHKGPVILHSRAQFEVGEIDLLRSAFHERATAIAAVGQEGGAKEEARLRNDDVKVLLRELSGYERTRTKDFEYVLEEAGLGNRKNMDFDEFVEVCSRLRLLFRGTDALLDRCVLG